jgi:hypothetical protein
MAPSRSYIPTRVSTDFDTDQHELIDRYGYGYLYQNAGQAEEDKPAEEKEAEAEEHYGD